MPRKSPRDRRSMADPTDWFQGAPSLPNTFTLEFDDVTTFDYVFEIGGATHHLRELIDEDRPPIPGERWQGLAQPRVVMCRSNGATPDSVVCTYNHKHVFHTAIKGENGNPTGSSTARHDHVILLAWFVSAVIELQLPNLPDPYGWFTPHLH
jgi:hypothetical protein